VEFCSLEIMCASMIGMCQQFCFHASLDQYFTMFFVIQGVSLARGPKLLSIKNYVTEIMT